MIRTDLALEAQELAKESGALEGVESHEEKRGNVTVTRVTVLDERGEQALGKPRGHYVTVEAPGMGEAESEAWNEALEALTQELSTMLSGQPEGLVLIVGLGNADLTPDALGPRCVQNVLVTRHIAGQLQSISGLEGLRPVAAIAPGVLGQTGVESGEIVQSLCRSIQPALVIVIDALASRSAARLGNTIQLSDTGIVPGSGVGNSRFAVNRETLGVPVLSIGVPMVVDAATLTIDVLQSAGLPTDEQQEQRLRAAIEPGGITMFVTPRMVDLLIEHTAKLAGSAINRALHPGVNPGDLEALASA